MAGRIAKPVGIDRAAGPIEMLARAQLAQSERIRSTAIPDAGPDLVPPLETNRPRGLAGLVDSSLGSVELPSLSEMSQALGKVSDAISTGKSSDPLNEVLVAVLDEEQDKIARYLNLRDL